jgi:hypothetical protein
VADASTRDLEETFRAQNRLGGALAQRREQGSEGLACNFGFSVIRMPWRGPWGLTVYRHVIVPQIRGGAVVMAKETTATTKKPKPLRILAWIFPIERKSEKPVELRGFEPRTFCMPCRRATSCAIAPCG